jgi:site-specific DNA-methyltransferase (adenine-specific)
MITHTNQVICGDCLEKIPILTKRFDGVITSPPYNLGSNPNHRRKDQSDVSFYSLYDDAKTPKEYITLHVRLFSMLEKVVKPDGVILFNLSYSSKDASLPFQVVTSIEENTTWKLRDTICWKKPTAMPFQTSPRNLSRITELIFVFAVSDMFRCNKPVKTVNTKTGQNFYGYVDNFIEAASFDKGTRKKHKATYSTELVRQLINIYFPSGSIILDPFCGTGSTGVACLETGCYFTMIDIDPTYVEFSRQRTGLSTTSDEIAKKRKKPSSIYSFFKG